MKTLLALCTLLLALSCGPWSVVRGQTIVEPAANWIVSEEVPQPPDLEPAYEWAEYSYYELQPGAYVAQFAYGADGAATHNIPFDLRSEPGFSTFTWRNPLREGYEPVRVTVIDISQHVAQMESAGYTIRFGKLF